MNHSVFSSKLTSRVELLAEGRSSSGIARLLENKTLTQLRSGIYIDTAFYSTLKPWEIAAVHAHAYYKIAPHTIFSHTTAALLLGLDILNPTIDIHLLSQPNTRGRAVLTRKHIVNSLESIPWVSTSEGLRTTEPLRTVIDASRILPLRDATVLADSALRTKILDKETLLEGLSGAQGWRKNRAHRLAHHISDNSESPGETLVRLLIDELALSRPLEQYEVVVHGVRYRFDFAWPELGLAIEFDGNIKYTDYGPAADALLRERKREVALQNAGWRIVRTDWWRTFNRPELFKKDMLTAWQAVTTKSPQVTTFFPKLDRF